MYYIVIFLLILILVVYISKEKEEYINDIFLTKEELKEFIEKDRDLYIELLSEFDLIARNASNKEEYKKQSVSDVTTIKEKDRLRNYCKEVDEWFKGRNFKYLGKDHNIDKIEWKIGFVKGYYEEGHPHTRGRIIILPSNIIEEDEKYIKRVLIHEKVHIYQRYNKEKVIRDLEYDGYYKKEHRTKEELIRGNPDIDEYIYTNPKGERMMFLYNSEEPNSIIDGETYGDYEHPFEMISYEIEKEYI
tara:strand:+ start:1221 stop:1958 length:738 start_codon:yes stop_codon:yes gene_type:complete